MPWPPTGRQSEEHTTRLGRNRYQKSQNLTQVTISRGVTDPLHKPRERVTDTNRPDFASYFFLIQTPLQNSGPKLGSGQPASRPDPPNASRPALRLISSALRRRLVGPDRPLRNGDCWQSVKTARCWQSSWGCCEDVSWSGVITDYGLRERESNERRMLDDNKSSEKEKCWQKLWKIWTKFQNNW